MRLHTVKTVCGLENLISNNEGLYRELGRRYNESSRFN